MDGQLGRGQNVSAIRAVSTETHVIASLREGIADFLKGWW